MQGLDLVIQFIRERSGCLVDSRFDILDTSFFSDVLRSFPEFNACPAKSSFSFSSSMHEQFRSRRPWSSDVDILYVPVLVRKSHWIGVIVGFKMWAMYIVVGNKCCPTVSAVANVLTPISILLPYLFARFTSSSRAQELGYAPFTMTRLESPILLEHPG